MTTWSWPSCHEMEYNRHSLHLPRGMWIYSYWDGNNGKDGNTCSLWWFSADESKIQDVAVPKDVDQHGDSTDQFKSSPPLSTAMVRKSTCLLFQYDDLIQMICALFAVWLSVLFCLILIDHMFVTHNIAHLLCKGHLNDISALLLFHHIKLTTLKEDNTDSILG